MAIVKQLRRGSDNSRGEYSIIGLIRINLDKSTQATLNLYADESSYTENFSPMSAENVLVDPAMVEEFLDIDGLKNAILAQKVARDPRYQGAQIVPTATINAEALSSPAVIAR